MGTALTFDRAGCHVVTRDGYEEHERFAPGAFDASIAAGGQVLSVGHGATPLAGSFTTIRNDAMRLVFRFSLLDGPRERSAAERIESGAIKGCSIAFVPGAAHYRDRILTHQRARLEDISLCCGTRPQWYDTWCRVVRV